MPNARSNANRLEDLKRASGANLLSNLADATLAQPDGGATVLAVVWRAERCAIWLMGLPAQPTASPLRTRVDP